MNPRVHCPLPLGAGEELELPAGPAQHLRVLRLRAGDALTVFNGEGGEYPAELLVLDKRSARVRLGELRAVERESPLAITLIQGIAKGERMDFTVQKAVELGAAAIRPVFTARSVVKLDGPRLDKRLRHWQGVIISACEQCGRNRIPRLLPALSLAELMREPPSGPRLVLDPLGARGLEALPEAAAELSLLIGPEGGLSEAELEAARAAGFQGLRLGPRVLRTETAGMAALAALQTLRGDLG